MYLTLDESLLTAIGANADDEDKNSATTTATFEKTVVILKSLRRVLYIVFRYTNRRRCVSAAVHKVAFVAFIVTR